MNIVYKHYDNEDNIIYVGITKRIKGRCEEHIDDLKGHTCLEHKRSIARIEIAYCLTRPQSKFYETYYINKYKPRFNNMENHSKEYIAIDLPELEWYTIPVTKEK